MMKTKTAEEIKAKIDCLHIRKLDAEQKSAQWLMKANDLDEKIFVLRSKLNKIIGG